MNVKKRLVLFTILSVLVRCDCELVDYIKNIGTYFGYGQQNHLEDEILEHTVPYEVSIPDQKFISEAAKLTGVALSELDSCQHRVVLKLQTSCDRMNDEQLAKMAVMLLNCQSAVEGRTVYPCTDAMSIKDCTSSMDADTWNTYHLMSNRARAVCYSVRQIQFRGLTEYTVNKLMDAARHQLFTLDKISKDQESLHDIAEKSLSDVSEGQQHLMSQQRDLQMAQLHGQLAIEDNIKRLVDEKRLIAETQDQLTQMTRSLQGKLEKAAQQLDSHAKESSLNHQEVLDDLMAIQNKAQVIFHRIEESSELLLKQSELAREQYDATLTQLAEVNATVHSLVILVGGTRKALEERLAWLNDALGGTDLAVERLYAIVWHGVFLLLAMVSCAFLGATVMTRLIVAALPPLNLVLCLQRSDFALDPVELCFAVGASISVHVLIFTLMSLWQSKIPQQALPWIKQKLTPEKKVANHTETYSSTNHTSNSHSYSTQNLYKAYPEPEEEADSFTISSPLPSFKSSYLPRSRSRTPASLNGSARAACGAKTRMGTPCKLSALPGRDLCYRHQSGDSVCG